VRKGAIDSRLQQAQDQFVIQWGRMSSSWGINRTMAQIHALLLTTEDAYTVDEIMQRLHISRGNASMNLRDLVDWGIIQRTRLPGDRKDRYQSNGDLYTMFARVVRERKRREIDPTTAGIKECLELVKADEGHEEQVFIDRLTTLLTLFSMIDYVYGQVFATDDTFRRMMTMLDTDGD
jgi:DNA-binding transcriptional regulator GbsR (MarR family)